LSAVQNHHEAPIPENKGQMKTIHQKLIPYLSNCVYHISKNLCFHYQFMYGSRPILCSCPLKIQSLIVCDNFYIAVPAVPSLNNVSIQSDLSFKPNAVWITSLCKAFPCHVPVTSLRFRTSSITSLRCSFPACTHITLLRPRTRLHWCLIASVLLVVGNCACQCGNRRVAPVPDLVESYL
jgi:hypothetical protein